MIPTSTVPQTGDISRFQFRETIALLLSISLSRISCDCAYEDGMVIVVRFPNPYGATLFIHEIVLRIKVEECENGLHFYCCVYLILKTVDKQCFYFRNIRFT
ncbi:hypothetical protein L2E82_13244 [Cichorium intybus]|uniref:Uncharacterized protein n=1 Tax=Cichorium intybus TaxID=13427 RepID=A0ACB9GIA5_CICIN|nr:hypothetical protein L2E82_13244 [Cichorium intybus]